MASNLPDGLLSDMLTITTTPVPIYLVGRLRAVSQLQLIVTLAPIGLIGLDGELEILNSINDGTALNFVHIL